MIEGLPTELTGFVQQTLASGRYQSENDLVIEALQLLRECDRRRQQLQADINAGLTQLESGAYSDYDEQTLDALFENIKTQGQKRLTAKQSQ